MGNKQTSENKTKRNYSSLSRVSNTPLVRQYTLTFNVPATNLYIDTSPGTTTLRAQIWGGGGGGQTSSNNVVGRGGGGGGFIQADFSVQNPNISERYYITVGSGGALDQDGTSSQFSGPDGTITAFGGLSGSHGGVGGKSEFKNTEGVFQVYGQNGGTNGIGGGTFACSVTPLGMNTTSSPGGGGSGNSLQDNILAFKGSNGLVVITYIKLEG